MAWGMRNLKISIFGSSIMEGRIGVNCAADRYYSILQKKLSERFPEVCFSIFNGAVGGWSTRELMQKYQAIYRGKLSASNDVTEEQRFIKLLEDAHAHR